MREQVDFLAPSKPLKQRPKIPTRKYGKEGANWPRMPAARTEPLVASRIPINSPPQIERRRRGDRGREVSVGVVAPEETNGEAAAQGEREVFQSDAGKFGVEKGRRLSQDDEANSSLSLSFAFSLSSPLEIKFRHCTARMGEIDTSDSRSKTKD